MATSTYGEPRATNDVDLVSDLKPRQVEVFVQRLGPDFYADAEAIRQAAGAGRSFNVINFDSVEKIDVFCGEGTLVKEGLERRIEWDLAEGVRAPVAPPEYMIVVKLWWYRLGGSISDRQIRDVRGVLQTMGDRLELDLAKRWAAELELLDLLVPLLGDVS